MRVARAAWRSSVTVGVVVMGVMALVPPVARAQVFGTWASAIPYPNDELVAGGFFLLGEPIGLVGQLRTGLGDKWDIGGQLGVPNFDFADKTLVGLAVDTKYLILPEKGDFPLDLAVDGGFGWQHASKLNIVDFDFGGVASKKLTTSGGKTLIPYGALMFAIGHASAKQKRFADSTATAPFEIKSSDTNLDLNVRVGLDWPFRPAYEFLGEINLSSREETIAISFGLMTKL